MGVIYFTDGERGIGVYAPAVFLRAVGEKRILRRGEGRRAEGNKILEFVQPFIARADVSARVIFFLAPGCLCMCGCLYTRGGVI